MQQQGKKRKRVPLALYLSRIKTDSWMGIEGCRTRAATNHGLFWMLRLTAFSLFTSQSNACGK